MNNSKVNLIPKDNKQQLNDNSSNKKINQIFYNIVKDMLKEMKSLMHKNNDEIKNDINDIIIPIIKSLSEIYTPYIIIIYTIIFLILCISIINLILILKYIYK